MTILAARTGIFPLNAPNKSHKKVPIVNTRYIFSDIPDVSFVLIVLIACGKKEVLVQNAAARPSNVMLSIFL